MQSFVAGYMELEKVVNGVRQLFYVLDHSCQAPAISYVGDMGHYQCEPPCFTGFLHWVER